MEDAYIHNNKPTGGMKISVYENWYRAVEKVLAKKFPLKTANALAKLFVLSAHWGAGDALAGMWIKQMDVKYPDLKKRILKRFKEFGIEVYDKWERLPLWMMLLEVAERVDFKDEEINKAMRELNKYAVSGGRYIPNFLKRGD